MRRQTTTAVPYDNRLKGIAEQFSTQEIKYPSMVRKMGTLLTMDEATPGVLNTF